MVCGAIVLVAAGTAGTGTAGAAPAGTSQLVTPVCWFA